jgi:signal peptidase I
MSEPDDPRFRIGDRPDPDERAPSDSTTPSGLEAADTRKARRDDWARRPEPRDPAPPWEHPAPPPSASTLQGPEPEEHEFHHPLDRVTGNLPRRMRIAVDWIATIVGAVAIVLAIKAWVINPYRIPSSSMEPTLHCARPASGCEARFSDRVLANRFIYHFRDPRRGEIIVFDVPPEAKAKCGAGGTFVKRIVGLPGEKVQIRLIRGADFVYINGQKLEEPYVEHDRRPIDPEKTYKVPQNQYFMMGDNRASSCDSRTWGAVPRENIIGPVFLTYWPPQRISFR